MLKTHQLALIFTSGIDVPLIGEKRPRAGTRIRSNKQQQATVQTEGRATSEEKTADQTAGVIEETLVEEEVEEVKESWDAESSSEEEVEETPVPETTNVVQNQPTSKSDSEVSESSSEEEESDSSDGSDDEEETKKTDAVSRREKALIRIQVLFVAD